jgi:hypothetical protein
VGAENGTETEIDDEPGSVLCIDHWGQTLEQDNWRTGFRRMRLFLDTYRHGIARLGPGPVVGIHIDFRNMGLVL